jgi:hypothetical protein
MPRVNAGVVKILREKGIQVAYTDNVLYNFTHAKFFIIDDEYFISTGNLTVSFFRKNREFLFSGNDDITRIFLEKLFLSDFSQQISIRPLQIPPYLVISPVGARERIIAFMSSARSSVHVYVQSVSDKTLLHELNILQQR